MAQLVFPSKPIPTAANTENPALNVNLFAIMQCTDDSTEGVTNHSPPKNKHKKSTTASSRIAPPAKHVVKSALKAGFNDNHVQNFPRVLVEASIQLKRGYYGAGIHCQFARTPQIWPDGGHKLHNLPSKAKGGNKKVHDHSSVPTNMTLISAHFKISSMKGENPFEKQKVWKNNKEVMGELRNLFINFSFAKAMDEDLDNLMARISHERHCRGGVMLKIKELQSFESETILCLFNFFTSTPKKNHPRINL
jgi:hypothetical protein